jgi:hypothetical protein
MNLSSLQPAGNYANKYGAKSLVYGLPGCGKTPITNTAPRPVLCCIEPGMLSMRGSNVPTFQAYTPKLIDEFFDWVTKSNEAKGFDTVCVDSVSQMAEVYLLEAQQKNRDGRAAYGDMQKKVMQHLNAVYYMQNKHTYLICKLERLDGVVRPYFPGKALNVDVPHLFDIIMLMGTHSIPGAGQHKAFRTAASFDAVARDRSGRLNEFEPCDLTALFNKVMA